MDVARQWITPRSRVGAQAAEAEQDCLPARILETVAVHLAVLRQRYITKLASWVQRWHAARQRQQAPRRQLAARARQAANPCVQACQGLECQRLRAAGCNAGTATGPHGTVSTMPSDSTNRGNCQQHKRFCISCFARMVATAPVQRPVGQRAPGTHFTRFGVPWPDAIRSGFRQGRAEGRITSAGNQWAARTPARG